MPGLDALWEAVFAGLERVRVAWPVSEWGYDRRLRCAMSTVAMTEQEKARAAFADVLSQVYTAETLAAAPPPVRALAEQYGGVRPGQLLLWGGDPGTPGAFGLWWPWGDGKSVSLRVGLHNVDAPKVRYPQLRDVFKIPQAPPG